MVIIVQHSHGWHNHSPHCRFIQPCIGVSALGPGFLVLILIIQKASFGEGAVMWAYGGV